MSALAHEAQVTLVIADFANADVAGKINVVGGGVAFLGRQAPNHSAAFTLAVSVAVPEKHAGKQYALSIELHDITTGELVKVPSDNGGLEPLRAQQAVTVAPIVLDPNVVKPDDVMVSHNVILNFTAGIPLPEGHSFEWRVQIDMEHRKHWFARMHFLAPAPGLVFGGPAGPANIPGVAEYVVDQDAEEPEEGA